MVGKQINDDDDASTLTGATARSELSNFDEVFCDKLVQVLNRIPPVKKIWLKGKLLILIASHYDDLN